MGGLINNFPRSKVFCMRVHVREEWKKKNRNWMRNQIPTNQYQFVSCLHNNKTFNSNQIAPFQLRQRIHFILFHSFVNNTRKKNRIIIKINRFLNIWCARNCAFSLIYIIFNSKCVCERVCDAFWWVLFWHIYLFIQFWDERFNHN